MNGFSQRPLTAVDIEAAVRLSSGPVLAEQERTAIALTDTALSARIGAACIDAGDAHEALIESLVAAGFAPQFPFIRMIHDRSEPFDDPTQVFAIAGPELG